MWRCSQRRRQRRSPPSGAATLEFHTFSIVAVDPSDTETGVAVTTRNPCVGNAVPWVRAGVGAVATQGGTRVEYGPDLLDLLAKGVAPKEALDQLVAADADRERRQVGVIGIDGRSAQWTGTGQTWRRKPRRLGCGEVGADLRRAGQLARQSGCGQGGRGRISGERGFAARTRRSAHRGVERGTPARWRRPSRRNAVGGGARRRSPARHVATARWADGQHQRLRAPGTGRELRRIYDTASETLGFRTLEQSIGRDVLQLKIMLHALGFFGRRRQGDRRQGAAGQCLHAGRGRGRRQVSRRRKDGRPRSRGMSTRARSSGCGSGFEEAGRADEIRQRMLELQDQVAVTSYKLQVTKDVATKGTKNTKNSYEKLLRVFVPFVAIVSRPLVSSSGLSLHRWLHLRQSARRGDSAVGPKRSGCQLPVAIRRSPLLRSFRADALADQVIAH